MANMFSLSLPAGAGCDPLSAMAQPTQLDKMLADERVRSEQHKNIYQKLKTEHHRYEKSILLDCFPDYKTIHKYSIGVFH